MIKYIHIIEPKSNLIKCESDEFFYIIWFTTENLLIFYNLFVFHIILSTTKYLEVIKKLFVVQLMYSQHKRMYYSDSWQCKLVNFV